MVTCVQAARPLTSLWLLGYPTSALLSLLAIHAGIMQSLKHVYKTLSRTPSCNRHVALSTPTPSIIMSLTRLGLPLTFPGQFCIGKASEYLSYCLHCVDHSLRCSAQLQVSSSAQHSIFHILADLPKQCRQALLAYPCRHRCTRAEDVYCVCRDNMQQAHTHHHHQAGAAAPKPTLHDRHHPPAHLIAMHLI